MVDLLHHQPFAVPQVWTPNAVYLKGLILSTRGSPLQRGFCSQKRKRKLKWTGLLHIQGLRYPCRGGDLVPKMCPPLCWEAEMEWGGLHTLSTAAPSCERECFQPHGCRNGEGALQTLSTAAPGCEREGFQPQGCRQNIVVCKQ